MRRPSIRRHDITDNHLRRAVRALGFKGKNLPLSIADIVTHENRPNESTLLLMEGEKRIDAVKRLREWAFN